MGISVVVHVYNEENCLKRTLRQLKRVQKQCKIEIIVVDEGSSDNSMEIARKYADTVVPCDGTLSFSRARNRGGFTAKSPVLIFIDPDILLPLNTLAKAYVELTEYDAATAGVRVWPECETVVDRILHEFVNLRYALSVWLNQPQGSGEFLAIRREAFLRSGGFNEDLESVEDNEFIYRLHRFGYKIGRLPPRFQVYESPNRFRTYGYWFTLAYWTFNALKLLFGFKPKKYLRIRH